MESELEGGAAEGLGPHGKPQRFYVIGSARTLKQRVEDQDNNFDFPDVLHDVPMPRSAVEQIFVDAAINLDEILMQHFPANPGESAADHKHRAHVEWKKLWRNRAVGEHGLFIEHTGLERSNQRGNGSGYFRWDVRRQKLEETPDVHGHPVDMLSRGKAIQRLRTVWNFLGELNSDLRSFLLPKIHDFHEISFATLPDDSFLPNEWKNNFHVTLNGDTLSLTKGHGQQQGIHTGLVPHVHEQYAYITEAFEEGIAQEIGADAHHADFLGGEKWKEATLSLLSSDVNATRFRYEFGRGPKPDLANGQASVYPTESTRFRLPGAGLGDTFTFGQDGRVSLGPLHAKSKHAWTAFLADEAKYASIRDGAAGSAEMKSLQTILRDYGHEPKNIWGRSLQGTFLGRGFAAIELKNILAKPDVDRREDIKHCLRGFDVTDHLLDELLDTASQVYDEGQEGAANETRAYLKIYALIGADSRVHALLWCQKWDMTKEAAVLDIKTNRLFEFDVPDQGQIFATVDSQPWTEGDTNEFDKVDAGLKSSLYFKAGGAREPKNRRLFFLLQLFAFAEFATYGFNAAITRIPRSSVNGFAPNFAAMADQAQTMGFQRAISPANQPNFTGSDNETAAKDAVTAAFPQDAPPISYSAEALDVFSFRHNETVNALFGPFLLQLGKVQTQAAFQHARDLSASFLDGPHSLKTWNSWSNDAQAMQPHLKAYFAVRVYPTAAQMLGSYTILHELMKGANNNLLMGGASDDFELSGGSHRMYVLDDGNQSVFERDDDGRLTALENKAMKIPENIAWTGTFSEMTNNY